MILLKGGMDGDFSVMHKYIGECMHSYIHIEFQACLGYVSLGRHRATT